MTTSEPETRTGITLDNLAKLADAFAEECIADIDPEHRSRYTEKAKEGFRSNFYKFTADQYTLIP